MHWFVAECIGPSHFIQIRYKPQGAFTTARTFIHYEDKIYLNIVLNMNSELSNTKICAFTIVIFKYVFICRQRQTQRVSSIHRFTLCATASGGRPEPGDKDSVWVSYMAGSHPTTRSIVCCLQCVHLQEVGIGIRNGT